MQVVEGSTRLLIPIRHSRTGPGKRTGDVFYNHQMRFNRDISVCLFRTLEMRGKKVLDAMAGTGVRGIRLANEAEGGFEMWINDLVPEAFEYIEANIRLNDLIDTNPLNRDLRCLLAQKTFDYVDIDPFGTPVPYLQSAITGCRRNGILAVTATDTAPLAGTYPRKCYRRYGARSVRCKFGHELGLRILMGHIVRQAAHLDRGVEPILCFYADHFLRVHLRMSSGGGKADGSLERLGYLDYDAETGRRGVSQEPSPGCYGPLWVGSLWETRVIEDMRFAPGLAEPNRVDRMLSVWREEIDIPFFYESDEISAFLGISPPPLERIIIKLRERGRASRTHFSPTGFKTDLDLNEIMDSFRELS